MIEAVRSKWRLFVIGRKFTIVTDQQAVSFMVNPCHSSNIKNDKILRQRLELCEYQYNIEYRRGSDNIPRKFVTLCLVYALLPLHLDLPHSKIYTLLFVIQDRD